MLYLAAIDRPGADTLVVPASRVPQEAGPWTIFEFTLPTGVFAMRHYGTPVPDLAHPDLVHTIVVTDSGAIAVIEYYNAALDHYFITADMDEIRALDGGQKPGWARTGLQFFAIDGRASLDARPVCRLYGLASAGLDTHFFSDAREECEATIARWPDKWLAESDSAFALPVDFAYGCDTDEYAPLFRLYDNRPDANHRYTTSIVAARQMKAAGWVVEGSGARPDLDLPYWSCALSGRAPSR
jgi:hypothetical protein